MLCAALVWDNLVASPHGQDRVVAGHTAGAVAHYYREETAVIGCGRRRGSIG